MHVEELVNYFNYSYSQTASGDADSFRVQAAVARSPWNAERNLLRISLKGKDVASLDLARGARGEDPSGERAEFLRLVQLSSQLRH